MVWGGELGGDVAGEADVDAGFGEGLDDDVNEGGAAAGEAGDGVHVLFVDDDGAADGAEDALGGAELGFGDVAAAAEGGDAGGEHGRGVGHGADDAEFHTRAGFDGGGGDGGGEGDEELAGGEGWSDLLDEGRDLDGFDAEEDNVGGVGGFEVIGGDLHAVLGGECEGAFGVGDGSDNLVGVQEVVFEEGLQEDAAHFTGAKDGDPEVGHGCGGLGDCVGFFGHKERVSPDGKRVLQRRCGSRCSAR